MLVEVIDIFHFNKLDKSIKKNLGCYNIQLYYPIITLYKEDALDNKNYFKSYYHKKSLKSTINFFIRFTVLNLLTKK